MNRKGECWKEIFLDTIVNKEDKYEYDPSTIGIFSDESNLYLTSTWYGNIDTLDYIEQVKYHYSINHRNPFILKFNFLNNQYQFGADSLRYLFVEEGNFFLSLKNYSLIENFLFVANIFSNKILVLDTKTLTIEKELFIYSKYTKIDFEPIPITLENCGAVYEDKINKNIRTKGSINKFYFDPEKKMFYVICLHDTPENNDDWIVEQRAFSIIIYDSDFNKIDEQAFPANKYNPYVTIMTSKGLLISTNKDEADDYENAKFTLFKLQ